MNFNRIAMVLTLFALSGCVSPTPYQPADAAHRNGYSDQRLADNRIRVSFSGNSATRREQVEDYLLLRAAETTREAGYAWFAFDTRDTEAKTTYYSQFAGWPGWGRGFGWYRHSWAFDPWGGVETTIPTTRYEAYAEIVLLTPEQARSDIHALRAADVVTRLGPVAARSQEH
jgi:hypothetical protein